MLMEEQIKFAERQAPIRDYADPGANRPDRKRRKISQRFDNYRHLDPLLLSTGQLWNLLRSMTSYVND